VPRAVNCQPLAAEARVLSQNSTAGSCGGQIGNYTGFTLSNLVFPCQYHSVSARCALTHTSPKIRILKEESFAN
jgi:hypothetical protein